MPEAPRVDKRSPILKAAGITKYFGNICALENASFALHAGEICAFVGANGAGKSTMVGILGGFYTPDSGDIEIDGRQVVIKEVRTSQELGIEIVYQDLGMVPNMDVVFNLFLGRPIIKFGTLLNSRAMETVARQILAQMQVSSIQNLRAPVDSLSGGQRQVLAVARALHWRKRIVILDEPAAALGPKETEQVVQSIQDLREQGSSIIVVSHNMDHVFRICDRVVVFRNGRTVGQYDLGSLQMRDLVSLIMIGEQ